MLAALVTRACQTLCAILVLALSVSAVKWQVIGDAPATNTYGAVAGAFALIVAVLGIASVWITTIPGTIMAIADGLSSILLLAGGIAFAVGLSGVSCDATTTSLKPEQCSLINGGSTTYKGVPWYGFDTPSQLADRCRQAEADTAFLFLGFVAAAVAGVLTFMSARGSYTIGKHSSV